LYATKTIPRQHKANTKLLYNLFYTTNDKRYDKYYICIGRDFLLFRFRVISELFTYTIDKKLSLKLAAVWKNITENLDIIRY